MDFSQKQFYENRELSWLKFNYRILNEARDNSLPMMERLKFLSITSSNLDEFFMVRVASLKDMVNAKYTKKDLSGMDAASQLDAILKETKKFMEAQCHTYNRSLKPRLEKIKIRIIDSEETLSKKQLGFIDSYFEESIYPVLTPLAVDASRPFPLIANKSLNIAALVTAKKNSTLLKERNTSAELEFVTVQVPSVLPRFLEIPSEEPFEKTYILLEQIIERNISRLFLNYNVICSSPYRIMRNADLSIDEDEASDLLKEIQKSLKMRQWGEVIRLEVQSDIDKRLLNFLKDNLSVSQKWVHRINGPLDLTFLMKLNAVLDHPEERYEPFIPQPVPEIDSECSIFENIKKGDIFLHHPYDSFQPVVELIRQASVDKDVLAIKQTLYRVSGNSPIIAALARAAENGKQVTVLVELKARFDEENNINWARRLEEAGCHVIYGLVGLKTHCKIALVVRREEDGIKRYVHLGTGNYNDSTAKTYTDCGIFTCSELIGEDATAVFNMLSGYSEPEQWSRLVVAPIWLRSKFYRLIDREIENAKKGKDARIIAKMNSLCDQPMIAKLYEASACGVKIHLIVRGICCLKTGIPGVSENITVCSIVGNFLEHSRIFYFYNDGLEDIYMGSADWMPRNLDRRVEIIFPVEDENAKANAKHILDVQLSDNEKAYYLQPDGTYQRVDKRGKVKVNAQRIFAEEAMKRNTKNLTKYTQRRFIPILAIEDEE